jgi:hypothetical protein
LLRFPEHYGYPRYKRREQRPQTRLKIPGKRNRQDDEEQDWAGYERLHSPILPHVELRTGANSIGSQGPQWVESGHSRRALSWPLLALCRRQPNVRNGSKADLQIHSPKGPCDEDQLEQGNAGDRAEREVW